VGFVDPGRSAADVSAVRVIDITFRVRAMNPYRLFTRRSQTMPVTTKSVPGVTMTQLGV
jgi:hypothetical protein